LNAAKFNFLAPDLVKPLDNAKYSLKKSENKDGKIILTWMKTNFSTRYHIEVAIDSNFKKLVVNREIKQNFFLIKRPTRGTFWWRVSSVAGQKKSKPSRAYKFIVAP